MLRLKRIISDELNLNNELDIMIKNFVNRNYPLNLLLEAKLRLSSINRCDLLQYKRKEEDTDKLILVQIYENKFFKNNRVKKLVLK